MCLSLFKPLLSQIVGIQSNELLELHILDTQIVDKEGEDSLQPILALSLDIETLLGGLKTYSVRLDGVPSC